MKKNRRSVSCITAMEYAALQRFPGSPDITMCNMARTTFYDRASRYEKSMKSK